MYSQNLEEQYILTYAPTQGRFLDVGANNGIHMSNTRALAEKGYDGVLVEPSPYWLAELIQNYPDEKRFTIIGSPLGFDHGPSRFWVTRGIVNTTDEALMNRYKHRYPYRLTYYACVTWEDLAAFGPYDVINIDVEGPSIEAYNAMPKEMLDRASVVIVEHNGRGYRVRDGWREVYRSAENFVIVNKAKEMPPSWSRTVEEPRVTIHQPDAGRVLTDMLGQKKDEHANRKALPVKSVIAVTYPRSGYHLVSNCLVKILSKITGKQVVSEQDGNILYMDGEQILFLSHDFDMDRPIVPGQPYLMMYRHPIFSISSLVEYASHGKRYYPGDWQKTFEHRLQFWKKHVNKWGIGCTRQPRKLVLYEDLMADPIGQLQRIVQLFGIDASITEIQEAISDITIRPKRTMDSIPYVGDEDINHVHEVVGKEMAELGITDHGSNVHYGNKPNKVLPVGSKKSPRRHPRKKR